MGKRSQERMTGKTHAERVAQAKKLHYTPIDERMRALKSRIIYDMAVFFGRIKQ